MVLANRITPRGVVVSGLYLLISIVMLYCDQYINLLPTTNQRGATSYIEGTDTLLLVIGPATLMFLSYFFQRQSVLHDVPTKHLLLALLTQCITIGQTCLHYMSLWTLGIVIKCVVNALSLVFLTLAEKFVFKKALFLPDFLGISLFIVGILWLLSYRILSNHPTKSGNDTDYTLGIAFEIANCLCGTVSCGMGEYVCRIDYVPQMIKHFGSREEARKHMAHGHFKSMRAAFWLGFNGLIALPLSIALIACLSLIPSPRDAGQRIVSIADFATKLRCNWWLLLLVVAGTFTLYLKFYVSTEVQIQVSSVATKLIKALLQIPVFLINIFIATNPKKDHAHLSSFDPAHWNEYCLLASFLFSILGVLVYYEVVVPEKHKRAPGRVASVSSTPKPANSTTTKDCEPSVITVISVSH